MKTNTKCFLCEKPIYRRPSRLSDKPACCNEHKDEINRITNRVGGETHPRWKGGIRDKVRDRLREKKRKFKYKVDAVNLLGGKCNKCGYNDCYAALEFHHVDSSTKDKQLKNLLQGTWSKILIELEKCIVLCSNCHREEHWLQRHLSLKEL